MYTAFVSSNQDESKTLGTIALVPCMRNGIAPFIFNGDFVPTTRVVEYITAQIRESSVFIGIYNSEYGERAIDAPGLDRPLSQIEFQLQEALRYLGHGKVMIFAQKRTARHPDLQAMISGKAYKEFENEQELTLLLDEGLKQWLSWEVHKQSRMSGEKRLVSLAITCADRPGILAGISRLVLEQGGNIRRSHQVSYLGKAMMRMIVSWDDDGKCPEESRLREMVNAELTSLVGANGFREIGISRIIPRDVEIKAKAFFDLEFFDGPGVAERVFSAFGKNSVSILESEVEPVCPMPAIGRIHIVANATNVSPEKVNQLASELKSLAGVFSVDAYVRLGEWWY